MKLVSPRSKSTSLSRPSDCLPSKEFQPTAARRQHRSFCAQRLGWLGADHSGQRRIPARQGLEDPDGKEFKVELVLIDDPVAMRDAYASGEVHIGWATLDMVPLFMEGFDGGQR